MRFRLGAACFLMLALSSLGALSNGCDRDGGSSGGGGGGSSSSSGDIKIGHFASMTGDTATFGVSADEGIKLARDEVNDAGGVLGRKINVITEDDRSVSQEARTTVNKLITSDGVVALIGEIASSRSLAGAPVAQKAQVPMISPGSTNPKVTQVGDYVFRACFTDVHQGRAIVDYAMDQRNFKKFAILYANNSDYSKGLWDFFKQAVQSKGGQVLAEESYAEKSDKDFTAQLTKIKAANVDAIYVPGYYTEAALIASQARRLGMNQQLLGGDGWDSDVLVKSGGSAVEGAVFTNHYAPDMKRPEITKFIEAYKKKYNGKVPDAMAILGYDSMKLVADAIKRAGGTEGPKIRDALAATANFPGASGSITIDKERNANKPIVIVQVKNGEFSYVTEVAATAK